MQAVDAGAERAEPVEEVPVLIVGGSLIGLATALCSSGRRDGNDSRYR